MEVILRYKIDLVGSKWKCLFLKIQILPCFGLKLFKPKFKVKVLVQVLKLTSLALNMCTMILILIFCSISSTAKLLRRAMLFSNSSCVGYALQVEARCNTCMTDNVVLINQAP